MTERILLAHGSGGRMSHELVEKVFLPLLGNPVLSPLNDGALLNLPGTGTGELVFTTDSFVVKPLFFPGGDIGRLAVCGTVNDLAMMGAEAFYLSAAFIIEEGLPVDLLRQVVESMARTAREAGVMIATGDTKVVERGACDQLFINTSGIGVRKGNFNIAGNQARPGDVVIVNGTLGDHGMAVMAERHGLRIGGNLQSDVAPLNKLLAKVLEAAPDVHVLRDPTRGGAATTLNEIAAQSGVGIILKEEAIPILGEVNAACDILGFDPLYVANEGKALIILPDKSAAAALKILQQDPLGEKAAIIGSVAAEPKGKVLLNTAIGGQRIVDMLTGEMLPRIC